MSVVVVIVTLMNVNTQTLKYSMGQTRHSMCGRPKNANSVLSLLQFFLAKASDWRKVKLFFLGGGCLLDFLCWPNLMVSRASCE